jgi:hypothetical protein
MRRRLCSAQLEREVVQVAEIPILARFEGPDDRVPTNLEVLRGMPILRAVAAPDMAAGLAHSQVHPRVSRLQTFLATIAARFDIQDLVEVLALFRHGSPMGQFEGSRKLLAAIP